MSWTEFDAARAVGGKDPVGKLALAVQESGAVRLPDGTSIHRGPVGGFVTRNRGGQTLKHHSSARDAAKHALDMSAQSYSSRVNWRHKTLLHV